VTGLYDAVLTRTYESAGGVVGHNSGFTLGAGYGVTCGYDNTGRFKTLAWNAAGQTDTATYSFVQDAMLLQGYTTGSGMQVAYAYEPKRNLKTSVQNRYNSTTISQYDYVYDPVGRRTSVADTGSAFAQAAFNTYGYNDRNELIASDRYLGTNINDTGNPVSAEQRGYQYDPIGNRTQATAAGAAMGYSANALNQYTAIAGSVPSYDPDGNMTATPDGMAYTYNAENRLIAAQPRSPAEGDTRTEYTHDYMGRRVQKVVYTYSAGSWVQDKEILFVYDGWNLIKETAIPAGGSAVDKYYVWGLDLSQSVQGAGGVGGLLAVVDGSLTYQYLYDANGNVGQVVDAADSSIAAHYEYDPYGDIVNEGGAYAGANAYRFSTKYFDSETRLYYYGYRYYSVNLGRWINRDPIEESGGYNLFSFIQNDPSNNIDNLGLIIPTDSSGNIDYNYYNPYAEPSNWPDIPGYEPNYRQSAIEEYVYSYIKTYDAAADEKASVAPAVGVQATYAMVKGYGFAVGLNAMFFPDSCEFATYKFVSGALTDRTSQGLDGKTKKQMIKVAREVAVGYMEGPSLELVKGSSKPLHGRSNSDSVISSVLAPTPKPN
jgi:RHS repeat-associated protein